MRRRRGEADYCSPNVFKGTVSRLFHNLGPHSGVGVRFEDVTLASGLGRTPGPGLGVICADFDGDGWPDIFIADDGQPNRLWINHHNGTFTEEAARRGLAYNGMGAAEANMGAAWGDVDGDGLADLFVTHLTHESNTLWKQGPRGLFRDETLFTRLDRPLWHGTGFGAVLGDFDNSGALDAAVVNGRVARGPAAKNSDLPVYWQPYAERSQLFANNGDGRFQDVSTRNAPFCAAPRVSRGLAAGDLFNDGSLDLLTTEIGGPVRLYRNLALGRGHWLEFRAVDPALHREAYGAEVTVRAAGRRWVRWVNPAGGFLCSNDPRVHFGLGQATRFDSVEVLWPDGLKEAFDSGPVDVLRELRRGKGRVAEAGQ